MPIESAQVLVLVLLIVLLLVLVAGAGATVAAATFSQNLLPVNVNPDQTLIVDVYREYKKFSYP